MPPAPARPVRSRDPSAHRTAGGRLPRLQLPATLLVLLLAACSGPGPGGATPPDPALAAAATDRDPSLAPPTGDPGDGAAADEDGDLAALMARVAARLAPAAEEAGRSVEGRPLPLIVLGEGPDTTLLMATIHGDEAAGTPLLERLAAELSADPARLAGRRVVLLPVVNPDGLARDRRHNARHVDLNRNFPASNRRDRRSAGDQPLSEPESRAVLAVVERYAPARVVSIHGWVGQVDWDGPGEDLARTLGAACALPAARMGSRPGSLGSHLGLDRGLPVITLELPSAARTATPEQNWQRFGPALLAAVTAGPAG